MEERETRLKATGFLPRLPWRGPAHSAAEPSCGTRSQRPKLLLVDNDDCFIHTLANYARQTGAEVVTYRAGFPPELLEQIDAALDPDLAGPGRPADFGVPGLVRQAVALGIPVFGVCLGLQGIVEAFGGELGRAGLPHARQAFAA